MTTSLPTHPVAALLHADNYRWKLHLTRELPHAPEAVWAAITEPEMVARWTPFRPSHDLALPGEVVLTPVDGGEEPFDSEVREVVPLSTLVYFWGTDLLRFDLEATDDGTTLALAHTFDDRNAASSYAAGWHICLGALELLLAGEDVPSVVGQNAMEYGWPELNQQYAMLFAKQAP